MDTQKSIVPPHVLVVDDDPAMRRLVTDYLAKNGVRVTAVATGAEMADQAAQPIAEGRDAVRGLRASVVETKDLARLLKELADGLAANQGGTDAAMVSVIVDGSARTVHPILHDEIYCIGCEALRNVRYEQPSARGALRGRPTGGLAPSSLRRVREHIETRFAKKVDLSHLARIAGLSTSHFCRVFKQSIGMPPHRYLTMRRLAAAADLIRKTPKPLAEVAIEVGFADQSHFTRVFTQMTGETPGALRRRYR